MSENFKFTLQLDAMDCGPACIKMVASHYGKICRLDRLRQATYVNHQGVSLLGISDAAESIGFRTIGVKTEFERLQKDASFPFIAYWNQRHFLVVYRIEKDRIWVADPAHGKITYTKDEFIKCWSIETKNGIPLGISLLLEPTPAFYEQHEEPITKTGFRFLIRYLNPYKKYLIQLALGMLLGSCLQLLLPFLTQAIVDIGINTHNINFIYLVLFAQFVLFISRMGVEFIRSWILLHISTRINISIISDFLTKMMKLPICFFDSKKTGDIIQRIEDHNRIESFLTTQTLSILFSMINLIVFGIVLAIYSQKIVIVFLIGSFLYFFWVYLFMKRRRDIDYKRFAQLANNQSNIIQLVTGMQEIKLNNCEKQKRWEWEQIQAKLFHINVQSLTLSQYQQLGGLFFNETKNIIITIMAATAVVNGQMTLGMMLAVQYILGQMNSPIDQMIVFLQSAQDAKLSLERLNEIHSHEEEKNENQYISEIPENNDIHLERMTFQYEGPHSPKVLDEVNITIPKRKITAIVGTSGSGKTTLIKLLLGFYSPVNGTISVGSHKLKNFNQGWWRGQCGVVMQDGFIFSDTITKNIAIGDETIDMKKLLYSVKIANIEDYIEELPLGYKTIIGQDGIGLSQGQRQRILIARAVYKDPEFIFFDEATNALDANNEKVIMENLDHFFEGRTVVVVAHRLSTVRNADQIIVIEKGKVVEIGSHAELINKKGAYFNLIKNQLELGD